MYTHCDHEAEHQRTGVGCGEDCAFDPTGTERHVHIRDNCVLCGVESAAHPARCSGAAQQAYQIARIAALPEWQRAVVENRALCRGCNRMSRGPLGCTAGC